MNHDQDYFDQCFDRLVGHEGGYTAGKNDPGLETKYGISKRSYPHLDIAGLTLDNARAIYRRDFWDRARCDDLPPGVAFDVFDAAVNSGPGQAVRWLQRAAGVEDDGRIGPITLAAVLMADPAALQARFSGHRLAFMADLSTWVHFGKGWARRMASNLQRVGAL